MMIFDRFQSKNIDELAEWLDEYCMFDCAPWMDWFDTKHCKNCDAEIVNEKDYSWCELYGKCKYFQNMSDTPDNKQIIKLWLESESE